jgi:hypothetical protein
MHTVRNQDTKLKRLLLATLLSLHTKLFNLGVLADTRFQVLQIMVISQTNAGRRLSKRNTNQPSTYLVASRSLSKILIVA